MRFTCRQFLLGKAWLILNSICLNLVSAVLEGPITNPANGHVYYLLTQKTWTASQVEAEAHGGNLATIDDQAEQQWVFETFGGTNRNLWIGLSDRSSEGVFRWLNGALPSYSNWAEGEPSFGFERYVHMVLPGHPHSGKWNNLNDVASFQDNGVEVPLHGVVEVMPLYLSIRVAAVQLSWPTEADRKYQLQSLDVAGPDVWTNIGSPVLGTGTNHFHVETTLDQPRRFFRIVRVP